MHFFEKVSRIRTLISERDAIDDQLRELIGEADKPKRGRPRKDAADDKEKGTEEPSQLSLVHSSEGGESA